MENLYQNHILFDMPAMFMENERKLSFCENAPMAPYGQWIFGIHKI